MATSPTPTLTAEQKLATLEAHNADLQAQIDALKSGSKPAATMRLLWRRSWSDEPAKRTLTLIYVSSAVSSPKQITKFRSALIATGCTDVVSARKIAATRVKTIYDRLMADQIEPTIMDAPAQPAE